MPRFLSCAFQLAATSLKAVAEQIAHCRSSERKKSPPVRLRHARQLAAARQNQEEADRTILYSLAHLVGGRSAPFHQTFSVQSGPTNRCRATLKMYRHCSGSRIFLSVSDFGPTFEEWTEVHRRWRPRPGRRCRKPNARAFATHDPAIARCTNPIGRPLPPRPL
jgi:hypothetical protein